MRELEPDYSNQMCADLLTGIQDFAVMYSPAMVFGYFGGLAAEEQLERTGLARHAKIVRMKTGYTWFLHDETQCNK